MARKRFTDADKWDDPWFRGLGTRWREAYLYLCDRCDAAGVWLVDIERMRFDLGDDSLDEKTVKAMLGDRVQVIDGGRRWYLTRFIAFQYPNGLSPDAKPHRPIIALLNRYGLTPTANSIHTVSTVLGTVQDKEKEKEKEKEKDSNARASGDDLFVVPAAALTVSASKVPTKTVGDLVALGAAVGREDRGDWEAALKARSFDVLAAGIAAIRARGAKAWLNVVIDEIDKSGLATPAPETYMEIDGVRYRVHA